LRAPPKDFGGARFALKKRHASDCGTRVVKQKEKIIGDSNRITAENSSVITKIIAYIQKNSNQKSGRFRDFYRFSRFFRAKMSKNGVKNIEKSRFSCKTVV